VDTWQNHKVGPAWLTGGHASPGKRSQPSVDFSRLGGSHGKSTEVQPFDLRSCEMRRELVFSLAGGHVQRGH
jgi:hypothetical protein